MSEWMFYRWHIFTPHLRWEVKALLAPQNGKGETEVEGGVHDVHVLVESHQVLLPVVLEAHQHHVGAQLAKTGQSHARLGTAHKVGCLCNVLGSKSKVWFPFKVQGHTISLWKDPSNNEYDIRRPCCGSAFNICKRILKQTIYYINRALLVLDCYALNFI